MTLLTIPAVIRKSHDLIVNATSIYGLALHSNLTLISPNLNSVTNSCLN